MNPIEALLAKNSSLQKLAGRGTRDLRLLAFTVFCVMFAFGAYTATFTNFIVQALGISPYQMGWAEFCRESPGAIMVLIAALTMRVAEPVLAATGLTLLAGGMGSCYRVGDIPTLFLIMVVWGTGMHAWLTIYPSMALSLADKNNRGRRLGQLRSVEALGMICGMLLVFSVAELIGFRRIFLIAGAVLMTGAVSVGMISRDIGHKEKPRLVWKRRYTLYYALIFLEGCRRQVFYTFAVFALVRNYGTPVRVVAMLMVVNSIINVYLAPKAGWLIDRLGERRVLIFCYIAVIPVFIGYALIKRPELLYVLYGLDNLLFLGSIGLTTYLHKIADPEDVMPSLAMGVSMNHVAAVAVPVLGGLVWEKYGYPIAFYGGAAVAAISVLTALRLKVPPRAEARTEYDM